MYNNFYRLKENPFNITADPDFFFSSKSHREALSNLVYGFEQRKGIIILTGEVGTGKTTLCRKILKKADKKNNIILIQNLNFTDLELLEMILIELKISTRDKSKKGLILALTKFLLKQIEKGHSTVIMIDEAQKLSIEQLEQLRLLSNLETEKAKLMNIVLVGQPELNVKLQFPELRQLRQRISVHYHIQPLEKNDVSYYITHRLNKALHKSESACNLIFTESAIEAIFRYSKGSPRTINILCDRALLAGFVTETHRIDDTIIENCAKEILYCEHYSQSTAEITA